MTQLKALGDVLIGDLWMRLQPEMMFQETGLRGIRDHATSLFPERQGVPGAPGLQNLSADDLPWGISSFAGGAGQRVIDADDDASFRRFLRSVSIDFSDPGELRLGRALVAAGGTGGTVNTIEGSAFADEDGTSTVVGDDRRLEEGGDQVEASFALTATTYKMDLFAYVDGPQVIAASNLDVISGQAPTNFGQRLMQSVGTIIEKTNHDPEEGEVIIRFEVDTVGGGILDNQSVTLKAIVRNHANNNVVAQNTRHFDGNALPGPADQHVSVTFTAQADKTYDYQLKWEAQTGGVSEVVAERLEIDERDLQEMDWTIKLAGTTIASGTEDLTGITAETKIASATFLATVNTYTVHMKRTNPSSRKSFVAKFTYEIVTMKEPRLLDVGQGDLIWLVDYRAASQPTVLVRDQVDDAWDAVGSLTGSPGAKAVALAHTESYEFVAFDTGIIWRAAAPSTLAAYTAAVAAPDKIAGMCVGGNRLLVLIESQLNGSQIIAYPLESATLPAAPLGPTPYVAGNKGIATPDIDVPQRMAATLNGAQFFVNQGPICWIHSYDGSTGAPTGTCPPGTRGRAIVHANGISWLGADLAATGADGVIRHRPALFSISTDGIPVLTDVKLYQDEDTVSRIRAMQLEGTNLWVLTEVGPAGSARSMRLWRVALRSPVGAFLEAEADVDDTGWDENARDLAINFRERFFAWATGSPYQLDPDVFASSGSLVTSRYDFALPHVKHLQSINVVGVFPEGTSCDIYQRFDGPDPIAEADFTLIGSWTSGGAKPVEQPGSMVAGQSLQILAVLRTTDTALTPNIQRIVVLGFTSVQRRQWELALATLKQAGSYNLGGQPVSPARAIAYLQSLVATGTTVQFMPRYTSPDDPAVYNVTLENPDAQYVSEGEAWTRLRLTERVAS